MANGSSQLNGKKPQASRVTNGTSLFLTDIDGRTLIARRFRDVYAAITGDLGGAGDLSEGERQLARRAASLSVQAELIEARLVRGEQVETEDYVRLVNALTRTLTTVGLKRRAVDVTPSLSDYLEAKDTGP